MTAVGAAAAICTSVSYFPQVRKAWDTGETGDLSLKMLLQLCCGLTLWTVYGVLRADYAIIAANAVSVVVVGFVLHFKLRNESGPAAAE
jgi:MtN3 and saliva related transmembrane protein